MYFYGVEGFMWKFRFDVKLYSIFLYGFRSFDHRE